MKAPKDKILEEINFRFGEWIENAGDNAPALIIDLLATMVSIEREKVDFYKHLREVSR